MVCKLYLNKVIEEEGEREEKGREGKEGDSN
jgi:hypothetical protein